MGILAVPHDFGALSLQCAPTVHVQAMTALVSVESTFRQFAIAVVDGPQVRQPRTKKDAVATIEALERKGYNYSVGYAQVNKKNFKAQGLTLQTAFDSCTNLRAGGRILETCFRSAKKKFPSDQQALRAAFSCYYSGNFLRGFKPDQVGKPSYVEKVVAAALGRADGPRMPRYSHPSRVDKLGVGWDQMLLP